MTDVRIERDCLGEMEIPNDQYYGIQTHRMEKVSGTANLPVIFYPDMHYALAQIKKAAAIANGKIGAMPADVSKAIAQACDEMLTGKFNDQFPLDMWQGGGYTCVNIPHGTLCGTLTQNIEERAKINTSRSVCAMIAINLLNIITLPLISHFGGDNAAHGYLMVTVLYGGIFTLCHWFCFAKTKEVVQPPRREKVSLKKQFQAAAQNRPYLIALAGQFLFGVTLYGRNADLLYYFKYVEGNENLFTVYSLILIVPSILGAAVFPFVFEKLGNKGHTAALFSAGTGVSLIALYFFSAVSAPVPFYTFAALSQFFFCGFNTAIYAIVPDCVEYGEWKTGVRNDGFQYAFVSLGNKLGMAIGTSALAGILGALQFVPNQAQNAAVQTSMHLAFSLIPGVLWLLTAAVLFFYRINKRSYNRIMTELNAKKQFEVIKND